MEDRIKKEAVEFLEKNPWGNLATVEGDTPQVRPWGFMCEHEGKLWFCTANTKEVFFFFLKNPKAAFSFSSQDFVTLRLSGTAVFTDCREVKEIVLNATEMVKGIYKTADNPVFEVFCLENGTGVFSDFSGNPPRDFSL